MVGLQVRMSTGRFPCLKGMYCKSHLQRLLLKLDMYKQLKSLNSSKAMGCIPEPLQKKILCFQQFLDIGKIQNEWSVKAVRFVQGTITLPIFLACTQTLFKHLEYIVRPTIIVYLQHTCTFRRKKMHLWHQRNFFIRLRGILYPDASCMNTVFFASKKIYSLTLQVWILNDKTYQHSESWTRMTGLFPELSAAAHTEVFVQVIASKP